MPKFNFKPKRKKEKAERPPYVGDVVRLMRLKPSSTRKRSRKALDKLAAEKVAGFHERERAASTLRIAERRHAERMRHERITRNRLAKTVELVRPEFE